MVLVGCNTADGQSVDGAPHAMDATPADAASGSDVDAFAASDGGTMPDASLDATPICEETEDNILGPFYKTGAPERSNLVTTGVDGGDQLRISGRVLGTSCAPLAGALVDVWQANAEGSYDNTGYTLRGQFHAAADGKYQLDTIIPGRYLNGATYRPAHIHVRVSADGYPMLTTQLYFKGDPFNATDPFIKDALIMTVNDAGASKVAAFDFVLAPA